MFKKASGSSTYLLELNKLKEEEEEGVKEECNRYIELLFHLIIIIETQRKVLANSRLNNRLNKTNAFS